MSTSQIDGTVVTQLKSKDELQTLAQKQGCRLPFDETMQYLSDPDIRILRGEEVINSITNKPFWAYSLGHDAIGLVMETWKTLQQEHQRRLVQVRIAFVAAGVVTVAIVLLRSLVLKRFQFDSLLGDCWHMRCSSYYLPYFLSSPNA
jgi:hypothetical protein